MAEKVIVIADSITVGELAETLNLPVTDLVGELFKNGIVATINQKIDFETVSILIEELGLDVDVQKKESSAVAAAKKREVSEDATERPPIVAVMGHVDHGKTSLLDAILDMKVVDDEAGGITQHISAYQTIRKDRPITLLDTPGHEAFAALRQHGAILTDVVIIVVAADDGVKPQTVEAIKFARNANAKIIVAINKIDKDAADPNRVKAQLAENGLNPEDWGGDTVMVEVSAKNKQGIDDLLDMVLLVADLEELRADSGVPAEGLVIEAHMEVGRGSVVGLLVEQGDLKPGDFIVAGLAYGKIRTLSDFAGRPIKEAGPSTPVTVTGLKNLPEFGDNFLAVKSEKEAKSAAESNKIDIEKSAATSNVTGSDMLKMISQKNESQEFNVIVKADVQGSLTSVLDSLKLIDTKGEIKLRVVGRGIGNISENDIRLAAGKDTVIYGFNVDLPPAIKRVAARDGVPIRIYRVIYELIEDARNSMEAMLAPEAVETEAGKLVIKGVFKITKDSVITGGEVTKGKIAPGMLVRVKRDKEVLAEAELVGLQKNKDDAKEAVEGDICGLSLKTSKKVIVEEGDKLEFFKRELVKKSL